MDGEIVHALFGLFDQGVAEHLPRQVLGYAVHLLQRLIDGHGADGDGGVPDDPVADVVDVPAGRQVHDVVGAPAGGPDQLVDLVVDAGQDGRVADVGVDLHQEVAADDHRLDLGVVDVGRDDGAAARDLLAHELGRDEVGDRGAEAFAVPFLRGATARDAVARCLSPVGGSPVAARRPAQVLADGDELHLGGDDPLPGVFELGHRAAGDAREHAVAGGVEARGEMAAGGVAVVLRLDLARVGDGRDVAAFLLPAPAHGRQAFLDVNRGVRVGVGARGVVHRHRRLLGGGMDVHLAEGDAQVGEDIARDIDLVPAGARAGGDAAGLGFNGLAGVGQGEIGLGLFGRGGNVDVHGGLCLQEVRRRWRAGLRAWGPRVSSLRRHDPDQVRRVRRLRQSQPLERDPPENEETITRL